MTGPHQLSDLQLSLMWILWDLEEASVSRVHQELSSERDLAMTTVATVLSRLERRGLVSHRTEGRQFIYQPEVSEQEVRRSMVAELTDRLFQGDPTALVSHLLSSRDIDSGDLARVRALLDQQTQETEGTDGE